MNTKNAKLKTVAEVGAVAAVGAAALYLAVGRGAALAAVFALVAGLAFIAVAAGWPSRRPWLLPTFFWAALSVPLVKHLGPGGGLPAVNADHVVAYPVDFIIILALAWVFLSGFKEAQRTRKGPAALGRALADLFKPDLISWAITASAVAVAFSLYHAPRPEPTLAALVDVARLYAVYVLFRQLAAAGARPVLVGLLVAAVAHSALCLVEFFAQNNFGLWEKPGWGAFIFTGASPEAARLLIARGGGTFEPNVTSQFLQMALPFAAIYFLAAAGRRRFLYLAIFFLAAAAMFVTFSRGGWLGAAAALAAVVAATWLKKRAVGAPTWALAAMTAAGVILLIPAAAVILARGAQGDQLSASYRLADWRAAFAMIRDHPLLGVGKGNYLELARLYNPWTLEYPVHNVFLLSWAETGILGLGAFVALLAGAFRAAGRAVRGSSGVGAAFGLAAFAAFAGVVLRMFVSMSFVHPFVNLSFIALAAAAAASWGRPPSAR
ncbi:MAG: O-antigen ligase family protein [bacterium]